MEERPLRSATTRDPPKPDAAKPDASKPDASKPEPAKPTGRSRQARRILMGPAIFRV